jgi:hypothetical protein
VPTGSVESVQVAGISETTGTALVELYDTDPLGATSKLINLSARAAVDPSRNLTLSAGFVVSGLPGQTETVLVRGIGPALQGLGVPGALAIPALSVYDSAATPALIATNSGWNNSIVPGNSAVQASFISASASAMAQVGAFPLTPGSADCAMLITLPPGKYTAVVSGAAGAAGVALVEIYESP